MSELLRQPWKSWKLWTWFRVSIVSPCLANLHLHFFGNQSKWLVLLFFQPMGVPRSEKDRAPVAFCLSLPARSMRCNFETVSLQQWKPLKPPETKNTLWWTFTLQWKITMLLMGKSTISMAIFNCYVSHNQRVSSEYLNISGKNGSFLMNAENDSDSGEMCHFSTTHLGNLWLKSHRCKTSVTLRACPYPFSAKFIFTGTVYVYGGYGGYGRLTWTFSKKSHYLFDYPLVN